jgi:hypothetical protein
MDSDRRDLTKTHPDNFKILIYIVESFGRFKHNGVDYISVILSQLWKKTFFLTFSDVSSVVAWASNPVVGEFTARREFSQHNPLPGAVGDEEQWTLLNPHAKWVDNFTIMTIRDDFVNVTRLLEAMKTKFDQVMERVTYSGAGKSGCLMTLRSPRYLYLTPSTLLQTRKKWILNRYHLVRGLSTLRTWQQNFQLMMEY